MLRKDMTEIKLSYNIRINELEEENKELLDSLRASQKLADMQMRENKKLIERKSAANKESRILRKEIQLMETEHKRVVDKNKDIKSRLTKLDRIVYGPKKGPKGSTR